MEKAFDYLLQIALFVGGCVIAALQVLQRDEVRSMKNGIEKVDARAAASEKALAEHKLFAAENYVRKDDLKDAEERLAERIDEKNAEQLAVLQKILERLPARH